jgi:acetylornithine deacetylase
MKLSAILALGVSCVAATPLNFVEQIPLIGERIRVHDLEKSHAPLFNLHRELVERPSVSGNEDDVATYLETYLRNRNFTVETQVVDGNEARRDVYAYMGSKRDNKVLLTSHIDTVPPFFDYRIEGDRIYGRGSVDAKSCVSAMITAFQELREEGNVEEGDLAMLFVVDEEFHGRGMKNANKYIDTTWDAVIFGEPTELKLGVGHKGIAIASYEVEGKASHSGYPELGVSANEILVKALNDLMNTPLPESELLGPSTLNLGQINGGVAPNVVPGFANTTVSVRIADGFDEVINILESFPNNYERMKRVGDLYAVPPQYLSYEVPGFESIILAYSTDIPNIDGDFTRHLYGPGSIHVAHGANEYVTFDDLVESVSGYKKLVLYNL